MGFALFLFVCSRTFALFHANFFPFVHLFQLNSAVFFHTIFSIRLFILMPPSQSFRCSCSNLCAWWFCLRSLVVCCPSCLVMWTTFFFFFFSVLFFTSCPFVCVILFSISFKPLEAKKKIKNKEDWTKRRFSLCIPVLSFSYCNDSPHTTRFCTKPKLLSIQLFVCNGYIIAVISFQYYYFSLWIFFPFWKRNKRKTQRMWKQSIIARTTLTLCYSGCCCQSISYFLTVLK